MCDPSFTHESIRRGCKLVSVRSIQNKHACLNVQPVTSVKIWLHAGVRHPDIAGAVETLHNITPVSFLILCVPLFGISTEIWDRDLQLITLHIAYVYLDWIEQRMVAGMQASNKHANPASHELSCMCPAHHPS